ncbi:MAG: 16S rRNA (cytosine(1402)-N(4))-methyltransferase RsmH [Magnetococcus sp. YQC-9]
MQKAIDSDHGTGVNSGGHQSVMPDEILEVLAPRPGGLYIDATFGSGGHTRALLRASAPGGRVIALDRDPEALKRGLEMAADLPDRLEMIHTPFGRLATHLAAQALDGRVDGVLFDIGVSSRQLDVGQRGFSFRLDGPLDMRMDPSSDTPTASDLVNQLSAEALADLFFKFGEERHSRRAARAIVAKRAQQPFNSTVQLATFLEATLPHSGPIHPATRIFQALRIAVNHELDELQSGLQAALDALAPNGRVAVISFHSLEDRIVKQTFRAAALPPPAPTGPAALLPMRMSPFIPRFRLPFKRPITPGEAEIARNPRARSAKLRVIERLGELLAQPPATGECAA